MLLKSSSVYFEWWVLIAHVQTRRFPSESTCLSGRMCVTVVWVYVGVQRSCEEHLLLDDDFTCTPGWTAADVSLRTHAVIQRCSYLRLDSPCRILCSRNTYIQSEKPKMLIELYCSMKRLISWNYWSVDWSVAADFAACLHSWLAIKLKVRLFFTSCVYTDGTTPVSIHLVRRVQAARSWLMLI